MSQLILFDSRNRLQSGTRIARKYRPHATGIMAAWAIVLNAELPDDLEEQQSYLDFVNPENGGSNLQECRGEEMAIADVVEAVQSCEMFNDYWAKYGWCLAFVDEDWTCPIDCTLGEPT